MRPAGYTGVMAYTLTHLQTLQTAIASGQLRVQLGDKVVQYQNLPDLLAAAEQVKAELVAQGITVPGAAVSAPRPRAWRIASSKGL